MRIVMLDRHQPLSVQVLVDTLLRAVLPPAGPATWASPARRIDPCQCPSAGVRGPLIVPPSDWKEFIVSKKLPIQKRKDIFLALVAAQDAHTMSVRDTQRQVQLDFAITESQLEEIIEEGVEKEWLDEYATSA